MPSGDRDLITSRDLGHHQEAGVIPEPSSFRSYGLTHAFLEVMGSLDSIQRINEDSMINKGFERMLLFSQLYPAWTLKGGDLTLSGGLRPQWNQFTQWNSTLHYMLQENDLQYQCW
ncbi:hypothetical protein WISP_87696 [Willisornis vidua]|uniref:Uncharacterized protein n=1 Tax=Willisornis vidua TaxID=1566151 RepID=A0ABQ9D2J6_9PASS|nr:hypothetical protein WISP_87696 [Willisornis vidua]